MLVSMVRRTPRPRGFVPLRIPTTPPFGGTTQHNLGPSSGGPLFACGTLTRLLQAIHKQKLLIDATPFRVHRCAMTIGEILDMFGGPTAVALRLGIPPTTVSNWKARESIPQRYQAEFLKFADGKVTAEMLVEAYQIEKAKRAAAAKMAEEMAEETDA
jgi:hypothetical protein